MRIVFAAALVLLAITSRANAQGGPAQVQMVYTFNNLSAQEAAQIIHALADKPFRDVAVLIRKLDDQIAAQQIAVQKAQEKPESKDK